MSKITIDTGNEIFHLEVTREEAAFLLAAMEIAMDDCSMQGLSLTDERWSELMSWLGNTRAELVGEPANLEAQP